MRLLHYSEAKAMLRAAGYSEREARWLLSRRNPERIPPQPHRLHSQALWSRATLERRHCHESNAESSNRL